MNRPGLVRRISGAVTAINVVVACSCVAAALALFAAPDWPALVVLAALLCPAVFVVLWAARRGMGDGEWDRRRRAGACPECGYCLTGNVSGVCPECGTPIGPTGCVPGGRGQGDARLPLVAAAALVRRMESLGWVVSTRRANGAVVMEAVLRPGPGVRHAVRCVEADGSDGEEAAYRAALQLASALGVELEDA